MEKLKVESFTVTAPPAYLHYEVKLGSDQVYLEALDEAPGRYKVTLREGQFHHSGNATGDGEYTIELEGGAHHSGRVLYTVPRTTPEGKNSPEVLEFHLQMDALADKDQ